MQMKRGAGFVRNRRFIEREVHTRILARTMHEFMVRKYQLVDIVSSDYPIPEYAAGLRENERARIAGLWASDCRVPSHRHSEPPRGVPRRSRSCLCGRRFIRRRIAHRGTSLRFARGILAAARNDEFWWSGLVSRECRSAGPAPRPPSASLRRDAGKCSRGGSERC